MHNGVLKYAEEYYEGDTLDDEFLNHLAMDRTESLIETSSRRSQGLKDEFCDSNDHGVPPGSDIDRRSAAGPANYASKTNENAIFLKRPLMERLLKAENPSMQLWNNYRNHPDILDLFNKHVYEVSLRDRYTRLSRERWDVSGTHLLEAIINSETLALKV
ncbi:hypothetical protein BDV12DRAFT_198290 [Aspergillus spectabilis]